MNKKKSKCLQTGRFQIPLSHTAKLGFLNSPTILYNSELCYKVSKQETCDVTIQKSMYFNTKVLRVMCSPYFRTQTKKKGATSQHKQKLQMHQNHSCSVPPSLKRHSLTVLTTYRTYNHCFLTQIHCSWLTSSANSLSNSSVSDMPVFFDFPFLYLLFLLF